MTVLEHSRNMKWTGCLHSGLCGVIGFWQLTNKYKFSHSSHTVVSTNTRRDFRLPPQIRWAMRSSGLLRSE